ncbi:IclR family transcriptional regulator [Streptomyces sp. NPDC047315]|uniref:IclR family transcriptional regulator n=1 Tax=Streptomyces sp. NPDC047315 TaxID=3155142 RepID=UPI0033FF64FB
MQAVHRTLRVLETVAGHQPIGVGELSRRCALPKSTVQRLVQSLAAEGWLRSVGQEQTRWVLTTRMLTLGTAALQDGGVRESAIGPMRELGELTGETVTLQVPDGPFRMVLIERVDCLHPVRTINQLGTTSPITATSTGLAFLALLGDDEVERVLARPVPRLTPSTVTEPCELRAAVAETRAKGYAVNRGQNREGVSAVGTAVVGLSGRPVAGIGLSLPDSRFDPQRVPRWARQLRATAVAVTAALAD